MKVSVSLPEDDVAFVDDYVSRTGDASRSAVVHRAITLLRMAVLEESYVEAWRDWPDEASLWDRATADGLGDAAR